MADAVNTLHTTLYRTPAGTWPSWDVYCWHSPIGRQLLVRFIKRGRQRKALDQVAVWHGEWDAYRWVPHHPTVPREVIELVKRRLREVVIAPR